MKNNTWNQVHFMPVMSLACNAGCSYCFGPNKGEIVTAEMLGHITGFMKKVVDETGQSKVNVTFHGGEPLMAGLPLWEQALSSITKTFPNLMRTFNIQSNLWNLTDDLCYLFNDYSVSIGTSLDGPEAINDYQRGKGYFNKSMQGIRLAEDHKLKPGCICTFTPESIGKYHEIFSFFVKRRLSFSIHGSLPSINGLSGKYTISPKAYGELLCNMLDLYTEYRHYTQISSLDQLICSLVEQEGQVCSFKDCFGMFLAIDPKGDIYPCQRFCGNKAYTLGNILSNPSIEELNMHPVAQRFIQRQEAVKSKCAGCEHFLYCKGGCTYNAWAAESDIDPYCEAYKMIFERIKKGLLSEMESEENIRAITQKPLSKKAHNPLLRKGALIELSRKEIHPVQIAQNAIKIVSFVELASNRTLYEAEKAIHRIGLQVTPDYLKKIRENLSSSNNSLNNLYLHLTFKCQLSCMHCYATAKSKNEKFMPAHHVLNLIDEAYKLNFRQAILTGGEPLLHPQLDDLMEQLEHTKSRVSPMHLVLRTNFVSDLSDTTLKKLAGAFSKIIVSIDGNQKHHDLRRGKGSYSITVKNLERYQEIYSSVSGAAELSLGCTLSSNDLQGELGQSVNELAHQLDIRQVRFRPILPIGRAEKWDIPPVSEAINSFYDPEDILETGLPPINSCGIGQNLYVKPDGNAFPCYAFQKPHSYLGNVIEQGLSEVLSTDKFIQLRRHTVDTNPKCSQCKFRYICGGACRAWGGEQTKYNLDAPPPVCAGLSKRAEEIYLSALNYLQSHALCTTIMLYE